MVVSFFLLVGEGSNMGLCSATKTLYDSVMDQV